MSTLTTSPLLTPEEAAKWLRATTHSLERWRSAGGGPTFTKIGRRVVYSLADLEAWVARQRREHTGAHASVAPPLSPRLTVDQ